MSLQAIGAPPRAALWLTPLLAAAAAGLLIGRAPLLAFLLLGLFMVVIAAQSVERLAVLLFWTLPYMVVNLPTGAFTLKLPEVVAYTMAAAFLARSAMRREPITLPPATVLVALFLAALALSAAFAPPIPSPFRGSVPEMDRNSPNIRPLSIVIWLGLSWLVVTALYNVAGSRRSVFRRCLRAHVLGGGLASLISLIIYALRLAGMEIANVGGLGTVRSLVPQSGFVYRLAGVAYEPLFLAFYLITVIPLTLAVWIRMPEIVPPRLAALCLAAQAVALFLTFSTGGWLGIVAAGVAMTPLLLRLRPSRRAALGLAAAALVLVVSALAVVRVFGDYAAQAATVFTKLQAGADTLRTAEIQSGLGILEAYPVLGVGPGLPGYHFPRYNPLLQSQLGLGRVPEVNNLYVSVLAESGLVGFTLFCAAGLAGVAALFRALRRAGPADTPALLALTASLVGCAFHYLGFSALFLIYFCALIGLATAAMRQAAEPAGPA